MQRFVENQVRYKGPMEHGTNVLWEFLQKFCKLCVLQNSQLQIWFSGVQSFVLWLVRIPALISFIGPDCIQPSATPNRQCWTMWVRYSWVHQMLPLFAYKKTRRGFYINQYVYLFRLSIWSLHYDDDGKLSVLY